MKREEIVGVIDGYDGSVLRGWAYCPSSDSAAILKLVINDKTINEFKAEKHRDDLLLNGINKGKAAFNIPLDTRKLYLKFQDDEEIKIDIKSKEASYVTKITNNLEPLKQPDIHFHIDSCEYEAINGWVADFNNHDTTIILDVFVNGEKVKSIPANQSREDLITRGLTNTSKGFHINIGHLTKGEEFVDVAISCNYIEELELLSATTLSSFQSKIEAFTNLQTFLLENDYALKNREKDFLTKSLIPGVVDFYRKNRTVQENPVNKIPEVCSSEVVSIVIPVYKGIEETVNCIKSVVKSNNKNDYRLVVISDCSPELSMIPALLTLQKQYGFDLLSNEKNLGFVATVNRGMKLAGNDDVILLNSDTVVPDGWLDAIVNVAYSSPTIGTVTPMSNNATICSFPGFCVDNELPKGFGVEALAAICGSNNNPEIDLPTAHGYCMFIKRQVLNEVGLFDEQKWGKGYAEENDFSLRANKLGWRHVMTNKTFIHHLGSVSFASDSEGFIATNLQKLNGLYPDYPKLVENFIRKDPARALRNELAEKILITESETFEAKQPAKGKSILFVSLAIGGGTKKATDDLVKLLNQDEQSVFYLTPEKNGKVWRLSSTVSNVYADYESDNEIVGLVKILQKLDVWHIHYHNVLGFTEDVWNLPNVLKCDYDISVHDYYSVCPRVNFVSFNDEYCGEKGYSQCQECLGDLGVHDTSVITFKDLNEDIQVWRDSFYGKFKSARKIFTPSSDTKQRLLKYFDLDNVIHHYHPETLKSVVVSKMRKGRDEKINLGFLGAIGPHKGVNIIKEMAQEIEIRKLPINLKIIGYTSDDDFFQNYDFVTVTGKYKEQELSDLIKKEQVDAFFLTSIWPETFSYTLSEALREGLYTFSYNIGAVPERLSKENLGECFDLNLKYGEVLNRIITSLSSDDIRLLRLGVDYPLILKTYYWFE